MSRDFDGLKPSPSPAPPPAPPLGVQTVATAGDLLRECLRVFKGLLRATALLSLLGGLLFASSERLLIMLDVGSLVEAYATGASWCLIWAGLMAFWFPLAQEIYGDRRRTPAVGKAFLRALWVGVVWFALVFLPAAFLTESFFEDRAFSLPLFSILFWLPLWAFMGIFTAFPSGFVLEGRRARLWGALRGGARLKFRTLSGPPAFLLLGSLGGALAGVVLTFVLARVGLSPGDLLWRSLHNSIGFFFPSLYLAYSFVVWQETRPPAAPELPSSPGEASLP